MDFDYIIVGGGSAGCVLANRLTARPGNRVLLLESGLDTPPGQEPRDILDTFPRSAYNPLYKWMRLLAYTQSLRRNAPDVQRPVLYDQGRVMGGGSSLNLQAANRGAPEDYDEWEALGAAGWGWDDVLPYFRKLEDDADFDGPLHGKGGPMPVQRMERSEWCGYTRAVAEALEQAGHAWREDQNGPFEDGYFAATLSNLPDRRVSAAMAYLDSEARRRPNLRILPQTHVKTILFEGRVAVGVEVDRDGAAETHRAREIVLSTGAVHTPALLMRSGVGPAAALSALDIPVVADVPGIGQNLRDHPGVPVMAYLPRAARVGDGVRPLQISLRYSSGADGCPPGDMFASVLCKAAWHRVGWRLGVMMTWVNKAYSVGRVSLETPDWRDEPRVELNLLEDPRDLSRLMAGWRSIADLFDREALRRAVRDPFAASFSRRARATGAINAKNAALTTVLGWLLDGPRPLRRRLVRDLLADGVDYATLRADDDALERFVRATAMGIKHLSCTCRMGADDDPMAVTRTDGVVRGVSGLRAVDASVMPSLPRANTNIPVLMLAEKISEGMLSP